MTIEILRPTEPGVSITLTGAETSLLMYVCNQASVGKDLEAANFATVLYGDLKRCGIKLPQGHWVRGHE